jgi:hypothetical protein
MNKVFKTELHPRGLSRLLNMKQPRVSITMTQITYRKSKLGLSRFTKVHASNLIQFQL